LAAYELGLLASGKHQGRSSASRDLVDIGSFIAVLFEQATADPG